MARGLSAEGHPIDLRPEPGEDPQYRLTMEGEAHWQPETLTAEDLVRTWTYGKSSRPDNRLGGWPLGGLLAGGSVGLWGGE